MVFIYFKTLKFYFEQKHSEEYKKYLVASGEADVKETRLKRILNQKSKAVIEHNKQICDAAINFFIKERLPIHKMNGEPFNDFIDSRFQVS